VSGYVLSAGADLDVDAIWECIAADNIAAADRWAGKLLDAFETLGRTPGMGHRREISPRIRSYSGLSELKETQGTNRRSASSRKGIVLRYDESCAAMKTENAERQEHSRTIPVFLLQLRLQRARARTRST
jgi:plasmid stabilization system protein ParE